MVTSFHAQLENGSEVNATVEISLNESTSSLENLSLDIIDITGKIISSYQLNASQGEVSVSVEIYNNNFPVGIYEILLKAGDRIIANNKIILELPQTHKNTKSH